LAYVAGGQRPTGKRTTVESLARHRLVEHTSMGWRITEFGQQWLDANMSKDEQARYEA
jgi:hypothetical protein